MPFAPLYWPARSMNNSLGTKEFDEEDFFVSGPTRLEFQSQSISGRSTRPSATTKVALLDGYGDVMTVDSTSTITLTEDAGPGSLSTTTPTRTLSSGVATWSDLKITGATGIHKLNANSNVSGVPDEHSLPINITN